MSAEYLKFDQIDTFESGKAICLINKQKEADWLDVNLCIKRLLSVQDRADMGFLAETVGS